MQTCLTGRGWKVDIRSDGGITANFPDGQKDVYEKDLADCRKMNGYDIPPKYSDDQLRDIYSKVVDVTHCIREQGFDPGTPPSEQTFLDQVHNGQGGWDPYFDIYVPGKLSEEEYLSLLEKCPRTWN